MVVRFAADHACRQHAPVDGRLGRAVWSGRRRVGARLARESRQLHVGVVGAASDDVAMRHDDSIEEDVKHDGVRRRLMIEPRRERPSVVRPEMSLRHLLGVEVDRRQVHALDDWRCLARLHRSASTSERSHVSV